MASFFFTNMIIAGPDAKVVTPVAIFLTHFKTVFANATIWLSGLEPLVFHFLVLALPDPVGFFFNVIGTKPDGSVQGL